MKTPRFTEVAPGIYRSPLPLAREIAAFAQLGGRTVVDLTRRERGVVARACSRYALDYVKHPLSYEDGDVAAAAELVLSVARPVLVHCFHGRDRTGRVIELILGGQC